MPSKTQSTAKNQAESELAKLLFFNRPGPLLTSVTVLMSYRDFLCGPASPEMLAGNVQVAARADSGIAALSITLLPTSWRRLPRYFSGRSGKVLNTARY
jgi:hypothetical protein